MVVKYQLKKRFPKGLNDMHKFAVLVASVLLCAATSAAQVLDGNGIRIEFDSKERGFDCLAIKNKLGGKCVRFGDGTPDGRTGLWALKFWGMVIRRKAAG